MALSDITRKTARSDLRSRLAKMTTEEFQDAELNHWLNTAQFDVFVRLNAISDTWYGTSQAVTITAAAGAVTAVSLAGNYAADKVAKFKKLINAAGALIPFVSDNEVHSLQNNSNYDYSYAVNHFGESLLVYVGSSATALSSNASTLYFIRKPNEMTADSNTTTILFTGQPSAGKYFKVWFGNYNINVYARASAETNDDSVFFVTSAVAGTNATNLNAALNHAFGTGSGVTATVDSATVTITGAAVVNVDIDNATFTNTVSTYLDVPTEFYDLVILSALSKALFKLNMLGEKQTVDADIARQFTDIRSMYGEEMQMMQAEKAPGVQTPRMK